VLILILLVVGFLVGLAVGRWWALLAPAGFGVWIAAVTEVEVPGWYLGLAYGAVAALGTAGGVLVRCRACEPRRDSSSR